MINEPGISLLGEFVKAASQGPAIYFAPLIGAFAGIVGQWRKTQASKAPVLNRAV